MGSLMAKLVRGTDGEAERRPQEQEPVRTSNEPHHQLVVRCGQLSAGTPGNKAYTAELKSYRGHFVDFPEEREKILDHFLGRFTFLGENSDLPLSEEDARATVRRSLSDPKLSRLAPHPRSDPKLSQLATRPVSMTPRRAHPPSSEEEDSLSEDYSSSEEEDASSVDELSLDNSPGRERLPIVRCGGPGESQQFHLLPGNQSYQQLIGDLQEGYLEAEPKSEDRKLMVDHVQQHFIFLRGDSNDRLSKPEARTKIIKNLLGNSAHDHRKPAPTQMVAHPAPKRAPNSATTKVVVRLGHEHSKRKGNIDYKHAVTNHRGDYLNAPRNSDTRSRIIDFFVDRFTFLDDEGRVLEKRMAREKVRMALGRAPPETRPSPVAAARAGKSSDSDSEQESSGAKLIVRSGKTSSGCKLPGNVAYRNEIRSFRDAFINGDHSERERIYAHFLDRFIFVDGHSDKRLSKREAKQKLRGVLGDPRPKRKSSTGSPQSSSKRSRSES